MRILHVNHRDIRHPKAGGLEMVVHELSRRWVKLGHSVSIVASGFPGSLREEVMDGVCVHRIGREEFFNLIAGFWLSRRKWLEADVVIEHLSKVACFVPCFIADRPFLAHVPHMFGKTIFQEVSVPVGAYVYLMERLIPWAYRKHPLWALSRSTEEELVSLGFPQGRVEVISGGVDTAFFDGDHHPAAEPTVLYVGRVRKYKGLVDPLLKAWSLVLRQKPDAKLKIVGRGDYETALRRYIFENGLEPSVELLGFVNEIRKRDLIRSAWCMVYPSAKEGWGLSVIEAGAMGIPTIASNSPGLRDAVRNEETGLLVPHRDVNALSQGILRLLNDGDLRRRLGDAARVFSKGFDWDVMAHRVLEFIQRRFPKLAASLPRAP